MLLSIKGGRILRCVKNDVKSAANDKKEIRYNNNNNSNSNNNNNYYYSFKFFSISDWVKAHA